MTEQKSYWTKEQVVSDLKAAVEPDGYVTQSKNIPLYSAAVRAFGSWSKACKAAGVKARGRGRPKKS